MTKKDYELIANAINIQLKGCAGIDSLTAGIRLTAIALADDLEDENTRFDKLRFLHACFVHTEFSDGGKAIQKRAEYMMS